MSHRISVLLVVALAAGIARGWLSPAMVNEDSAFAQAEPCPLTDCDFSCTRQGDPWYGETGVWVIVHARPMSPSGELRWWDTGSQYWAPMELVGTWEESDGGGTTISSTVTVDDDGDCDYSQADGRIRCHTDLVNNPLCDNYAGVWDKDSVGASDYCLSQTNQGYDFRKELYYNGEWWCFKKADVLSVQPNGSSSLKPRTKHLNGGCDAQYGTRFIEDSEVAWMCQQEDEQRPDGSVDRLDVILNYNYEQ